MKTVYNNSEVFHLWAHQTQCHARGSGNLSFYGLDAYSYRALIGRIVENTNGEKAYLVSTRRYSVTTSAHQSLLRRAIPADSTVFCLENIGDCVSPSAMLKEILDRIPDLSLKAKRARVYKGSYLSQIQVTLESARRLSSFFSIPMPEEFNGVDEADLQQQIDAATAVYEAELKRQAEEEKKREAIRLERAKESLSAWLNGETAYVEYIPFAYMRLSSDGGTVETTQGARVPTEHVKKVAPMILRVLNNGKNYAPDSDIRLGHYRLNGIRDGIVTVGCHRFEESEIRRFAAILGVSL